MRAPGRLHADIYASAVSRLQSDSRASRLGEGPGARARLARDRHRHGARARGSRGRSSGRRRSASSPSSSRRRSRARRRRTFRSPTGAFRADAFSAPFKLRAELRSIDRPALLSVAAGDPDLIGKATDELRTGAEVATARAALWGLGTTALLAVLTPLASSWLRARRRLFLGLVAGDHGDRGNRLRDPGDHELRRRLVRASDLLRARLRARPDPRGRRAGAIARRLLLERRPDAAQLFDLPDRDRGGGQRRPRPDPGLRHPQQLAGPGPARQLRRRRSGRPRG